MSVSPDDLRRQAFPVLDAAQIAALRPFASERATQPGDVLFEIGESYYPLVEVLAGKTQILERSEGADRVIKESGPGEFHGELGMLTGQRAFAACVVAAPGRVLLVQPAAVQEVIRTVPELSDILVVAFAARREILMRSAAATLSIIGIEESAPVRALQGFLDRNRIPHRFIARADPAMTAVLAPFGCPPPDQTLVVVSGSRLLADPTPLDLARALGLDLVVDQTEPADLLVVGGGNSAGQATMFLSRYARRVHHVYRGSGLRASMSDYLIARLKRVPNIKL